MSGLNVALVVLGPPAAIGLPWLAGWLFSRFDRHWSKRRTRAYAKRREARRNP